MNIFDQFRLDGKVALVTGGSRGLGLEMSLALAQAGARVAILARREKFFAETLAAIPDALCLLGDVANESDVQAAVAKVKETWGPVQVLINAAGIAWGGNSMEMTADKLREVMAVNFDGTYFGCKAVAPDMQAAGYGKIINIASVTGEHGEPPEIHDAVGYSASKGAVITMTRDLAVKWGRFGIRVNAISPGYFPTRMTEKVLVHTEAMLAARVPLGRVGKPGELAGAALYLASPASDYVSGHILTVDGGYTV